VNIITARILIIAVPCIPRAALILMKGLNATAVPIGTTYR